MNIKSKTLVIKIPEIKTLEIHWSSVKALVPYPPTLFVFDPEIRYTQLCALLDEIPNDPLPYLYLGDFASAHDLEDNTHQPNWIK